MAKTQLASEDIDDLRQEAHTLARLVHPHIVRILDFNIQQTIAYIIMDYAPNGNVRTLYPRGTRLPLPTVIEYVQQAASALQYAHNERLIHRDIKPENLLLGRKREILLSDFGIASLAHTTQSQSIQEIIGTAAYMAPEQFQGRPRPASDQYALGILVYEWLSGTRPFHGNFLEVASQHLLQPPPLLQEKVPDLPLEVAQVVMTALAKDPKQRFSSVQSFATALEQASHAASPQRSSPSVEEEKPVSLSQLSTTAPLPPVSPPTSKDAVSAQTQQISEETYTPEREPRTLSIEKSSSNEIHSPLSKAPVGKLHMPESTSPLPAEKLTPPPPPGWKEGAQVVFPKERRGFLSIRTLSFVGLATILILGASGLLYAPTAQWVTHLFTVTPQIRVIGTGITNPPAHGGTWVDDLLFQPDSLLPNAGVTSSDAIIEQALYAPLFFGDANGTLHPGLAAEIPTVANGDVSSDAKTWTVKLKPDLKWSDGQPLDAQDIDYTWKLYQDPKFGAANSYTIIASAAVSADKQAITFHLQRAYAPFLSLWTDGLTGPLPRHHFASMAPDTIIKSTDALKPTVVSGPFMLNNNSVPDQQYTLVSNPNYYRRAENLPYLDKIIFHLAKSRADILSDLRAGTVVSSWNLDISQAEQYKALANYKVVTNPNSANFEIMHFDLKNPILGKDRIVRQAMAMAIDHTALIKNARHGLALPLCTDHGTAYHPGYQADAPCPQFNPTAANQLLDQDGWIKGSDGVRTKGSQRLEFTYATLNGSTWYQADALLLQQNFSAIGVKVTVHTLPASTFFETAISSGAYDLLEYENALGYDADDSSLFACNEIPPSGLDASFYCNSNLDRLYTAEQSTLDPTARQHIFNQIHQIYLTDFPFVILYSPDDTAIAKKTVHNYLPSPSFGAAESINIWEWWCNGGQC